MKTHIVSHKRIAYPLSKHHDVKAAAINDELINVFHKVKHWGYHRPLYQVKSNTKQWNKHVRVDLRNNVHMEINSNQTI